MNFFRVLKFGGQHFVRNIWLSIATVTILLLTLVSGHVLVALNILGQTAVKDITARIDISAHFKPEIPPAQVQSTKSALLNMPEVKDVQYLTPADSLQAFLALHKNDPVALGALSEAGQNPFGATLVIKARRLDDYPAIAKILSGPAYAKLIDSADYDDRKTMITRIQTIAKKLEAFFAGVSALFVAITLLIVFTTIRVSIYTHREEIGIMRLVGASNQFIRGQFYVEALLWSVATVGVMTALLLPTLRFVEPYVEKFFGSANVTLLPYYQTNLGWMIGAQLLIVGALSLLTTKIATARYVKI